MSASISSSVPFFPSFLLSFLPSFLQPFLPSALHPFLPSALPHFFSSLSSSSSSSSFPSPSFLSSSPFLPPSLPSLPSSLPSFLPSLLHPQPFLPFVFPSLLPFLSSSSSSSFPPSFLISAKNMLKVNLCKLPRHAIVLVYQQWSLYQKQQCQGVLQQQQSPLQSQTPCPQIICLLVTTQIPEHNLWETSSFSQMNFKVEVNHESDLTKQHTVHSA